MTSPITATRRFVVGQAYAAVLATLPGKSRPPNSDEQQAVANEAYLAYCEELKLQLGRDHLGGSVPQEILEAGGMLYRRDMDDQMFIVLDNNFGTTPPEGKPHVVCATCLGTLFRLEYGGYEIKAMCECGAWQSVYSG